MRTYSLFLVLFFAVCAVSLAFAQNILVNEVGYEQSGPKRAVIQSSANISDTKAYLLQGSTTVLEINLGEQKSVSGWGGRNFKVADFSEFKQTGTYKLRVGSKESRSFEIGEKILQEKTGAFQVSFFNGMRNTSDGDRNLKIYGSTQYHNMYGGWNDAAGDEGKHISHLSYAHYFNPQQIPLVSYALLHANEMQPNAYGNSAKAEAAWGTDYLLRALSRDNYFYISVFDNWGQNGYSREICNWFGEDGDRDGKFQSSFRGGGGVSIAALARASKMNVRGDSSSEQYLEGAKRAYANLKTKNISYLSNGVENIIDDYAALLAATELYNATQDDSYKTDASNRAQSLISRQSDEGWFYKTSSNTGKYQRQFYHAADEGLPVFALARYLEVCKPENKQAIRNAIKKNLQWYAKITYERPNPFEYAKMYGDVSSGTNPGEINLALSGTATASREEGGYPASNAIDGSSSTRWSSYQNGADNNNQNSQWIYVDLGNTYKVNKVRLNWEAAYGKSYKIEVSTNGSSWNAVANITNNTSGGIKEHTFASTNAQFVRMSGVERGNEYGGYSLYEFEIYGEPSEQQQQPSTPHNARFFMPQDNETGYWWQGENARIASLASAFIMGAPSVGNQYWADTLFGMATAQLDWILGKNPFAITMMYGFGETNYPQYNSSKPKPNIKGGICNGITAKRGNENDLEWKPYEDYGENAWKNWRWIEQWLPHNAWYLIAISSLSHRIDNPVIEDPDPIIAKNRPQLGIQINQRGGVLYMSSQKDVIWKVHNLQGKLLFSSNSRETKWNPGNFKGTVAVSAFNGSVAESKLFSIL